MDGTESFVLEKILHLCGLVDYTLSSKSGISMDHYTEDFHGILLHHLLCTYMTHADWINSLQMTWVW